MSRGDRFVATTWWTAHIAARGARGCGGERFLYLIQEYEPFTFPMGSHAALAAESYRLPHPALFSTELLRDCFRSHGIGVYAAGTRRATPASSRSRTRSRRCAARRPTELAARRAAAAALLRPARGRTPRATCSSSGRWRSAARSSAARSRRLGAARDRHGRARRGALDLGGGAALELLPRPAQDAYAALLRDHDVGLALMYTPHPSLVPIEMASAGMLTVTNTFENKTAGGARGDLAEPDRGGAERSTASWTRSATAAAGAGDVERRVRGSRGALEPQLGRVVRDALMDRVVALLGSDQPTRTVRTGE